MKACPKCETLWDDGKRFCPYHGILLTVVAEHTVPEVADDRGVDTELTVRMSEEERAQLFKPQLPPASPLPEQALPAQEVINESVQSTDGAAQALLSESVPPFVSLPLPPSSPEAVTGLEDPPTAKVVRTTADASFADPPPDVFDPFIPPTVVVTPSAFPAESMHATPSVTSPSALDVFIPPTVVVAPSQTAAVISSQSEREGPAPSATVRLADDANPLTMNPGASPTMAMDASATHVHLNLASPGGPRPPVFPPGPAPTDAEDDVGFILDLGEKSSARLPASTPPAAVEPPPPASRSLTPSALPSLVPPASPTIKRLTAVQYFKLFNERKKVIQQFVQQLDAKRVQVSEGHSNQEDFLMHRYDLAFRSLMATRTFPLVIILQRKPVYGLITSIDLYEIAESPMLREERTKSLGGDCKSTPNGVIYHLSYAEDCPTEQLGDWLRTKFQSIAGLIPGASL